MLSNPARIPFLTLITLFASGLSSSISTAQTSVSSHGGSASAARFAERRAAVMRALPDGILLLHARPDVKDFRESGFHQDINFFYFAGVDDVTNAILAIDGVRRKSWLFVPTNVKGLPAMVGTTMQPGADAAAATGIEHVVGWSEFAEFIDRHAGGKIYLPGELGGSSSNPRGMAPVGDPDVLWVHAIGLRWPEADIESAATAIREMRMIKDSSEVAALRLAGRASAAAFRAGLQAIGPDVSQRTAEGAVIARCLSAGGDGIAFWPWVMSGANGIFPTPFTSFGDYRHLNRRMQSGELVRVDIGCEADYYQGDVGRTAPVSGVFSAGQREAWNLLVAAYQAGLAVIKDGVAWSDVEAAARAEVSSISDDPDRAPTTDLGKQAAALLMSDDGVEWHQHGIGLWASEPAVSVLRAGMVIAFEPMMAVDGQGYYLEDMLLITATGYEVLTPGLPYTAAEIEAVMSEE